MTTDNKAIVKEFIDRLFTDGDVSVLDELAAPDYVDHDPPFGGTALAMAAVFVALMLLVRRLTFVPRIVVDNRTSDVVDVDVAGSPQGSILHLGVLDARSSASFEDVIDQGDHWSVHVDTPTHGIGELSLTRDQFARSH